MNRLIVLFLTSTFLFTACSEKTTSSSRTDQTVPEESAAPETISPEGITYTGSGTVGEYEITWELFVSATQISGTYQYAGQDQFLQLSGEASGDACILTETDPEGAITGSWRLFGFPNPHWNGSWKKDGPNGQDSLFVTLEAKEAILLSPTTGWPEKGLSLISKEVSLHSPDSMCRVIHELWRATGRDDLSRAYNTANPAPSFQNRTVGLTDCIDARADAGDVASDYPPSGEESAISLGIPFRNILPVHADYYEYYAGAAHGNYGQFTKHLQLPGFEEINPEELFVEGYRSLFEEKIREDLTRQFGSDGAGLEFEELPEKFHFELHPTQLVVYFNPYEIGPYVLGQIRIPIAYESIKEVIREEGPLGGI